LLSIHDEVIFEVDEQIADIAEKMVAYEMEHAVELGRSLYCHHLRRPKLGPI
jgi:DNA polymerase I-like protein with 3'-5' exonuclease and polymerase domains